MRYLSEELKQILDYEKMSKDDQLEFFDFIYTKDSKLIEGLEIEEELFYQAYSSEIEFYIFEERINSLLLYMNDRLSS